MGGGGVSETAWSGEAEGGRAGRREPRGQQASWPLCCPVAVCDRFSRRVLWTCRGPPRRPPPHILDQVKSLNQSLRLGHLLCRSRNPDFLLNIIQRQASVGGAGRGGRRALPGLQHPSPGEPGPGRAGQDCVPGSRDRPVVRARGGGGDEDGQKLRELRPGPCRPRRSPCPGWLTWCRPARAPWTCCPCSACASSCCTTLLMTPPPGRRRRRAGARNRRPRSGRWVLAPPPSPSCPPPSPAHP